MHTWRLVQGLNESELEQQNSRAQVDMVNLPITHSCIYTTVETG